jgi:hypothetical protein
MKLEKARDWADLSLKCLSIIAILVGGVWAFYQYRVARTDVSNVEISVSSEIQQYSEGSRLLILHIRPKNIGKVMVTAEKSFTVVVKRIPTELKVGEIDLEKLSNFYQTDLLKRYQGAENDGYDLEPGVEYDEIVALIVPRGSMYSIKATLNFDGEYEVDHTVVARAS